MAASKKVTPKKSNYTSKYEKGSSNMLVQNTAIKRTQAGSKNGKLVTNVNQVDYLLNDKNPTKKNAYYSKSTSVVDTAGYSKGKKEFPAKKYTTEGSNSINPIGGKIFLKKNKLTKSKVSRLKVDESLKGKILKKGGKVTTKPKKK